MLVSDNRFRQRLDFDERHKLGAAHDTERELAAQSCPGHAQEGAGPRAAVPEPRPPCLFARAGDSPASVWGHLHRTRGSPCVARRPRGHSKTPKWTQIKQEMQNSFPKALRQLPLPTAQNSGTQTRARPAASGQPGPGLCPAGAARRPGSAARSQLRRRPAPWGACRPGSPGSPRPRAPTAARRVRGQRTRRMLLIAPLPSPGAA